MQWAGKLQIDQLLDVHHTVEDCLSSTKHPAIVVSVTDLLQ
jgi:hypothetical protein